MIKVLIVEDDPMVADINKRYINSVDGSKWLRLLETALLPLDIAEKEK